MRLRKRVMDKWIVTGNKWSVAQCRLPVLVVGLLRITGPHKLMGTLQDNCTIYCTGSCTGKPNSFFHQCSVWAWVASSVLATCRRFLQVETFKHMLLWHTMSLQVWKHEWCRGIGWQSRISPKSFRAILECCPSVMMSLLVFLQN